MSWDMYLGRYHNGGVHSKDGYGVYLDDYVDYDIWGDPGQVLGPAGAFRRPCAPRC